MVSFEETKQGILVVQYAESADLSVESQQPLIARLDEKRGRVVIIFEVGANVRSVPMDVPTFWLGVTGRLELQLAGIGIVTRSAGVRVAARGFGLANLARRIPISVESFTDLAEASEWGQRLLANDPPV